MPVNYENNFRYYSASESQRRKEKEIAKMIDSEKLNVVLKMKLNFTECE